MNTRNRELKIVTSGVAASDGDGVKLTRVIGSPEINMLDPFLLFDAFESDRAEDYIGGFPSHPHRGFETVTYLLAGQMRHKDNAGHEGVIEPGGVQWMSAAKGIVHSEMPEQKDGLLMGFQLWVNLPASAKMGEPEYQEFPAKKIALEKRENATEVRVISGTTDCGTSGPVINNHTHPLYMDITLVKGQSFEQSIGLDDNTFIFVIKGKLSVGSGIQKIEHRQLGVLHEGDNVYVSAEEDSQFLLISAEPLNEPIARGGPFVMNTKAEVLQAFEDFQSNRI